MDDRTSARAGLVLGQRAGHRVLYRLASERVGELWAAVRDVAARHVAEFTGAQWMDPTRLYEQVRRVSRDADVVAYCRGDYCDACETIRALAADGIRAARLEEGFPEWRRAGLSVDATGERDLG